MRKFNELSDSAISAKKFIYTRQSPYSCERLIFSRSNKGKRINFMKCDKAIPQQQFNLFVSGYTNTNDKQCKLFQNCHFQNYLRFA